MTDPYLFEKAIGQQMGDLCRLAVGDAKVTQTGDIVTMDDMPGRGNMDVSVEVPYTAGGVSAVEVTRCGKNLWEDDAAVYNPNYWVKIGSSFSSNKSSSTYIYNDLQLPASINITLSAYFTTISDDATKLQVRLNNSVIASNDNRTLPARYTVTLRTPTAAEYRFCVGGSRNGAITFNNTQIELGSTATDYEPYNGDTYTITMPADFYGGSIDLEAGTVTSRYAADGTELSEPVVTEIDPIAIPILAGVNNVWADTGTVAVSYYAADAETFRPVLWYPTIYRGLTSARYIIKRASGAIASFSDAIAAPLVGLRVALPWRSEGYGSVSVTRCGKVLFQNPVDYESTRYTITDYSSYNAVFGALSRLRLGTYKTYDNCKVRAGGATGVRIPLSSGIRPYFPDPPSEYAGLYIGSQTITNEFKTASNEKYILAYFGYEADDIAGYHKNLRYCLPDVELTDADTYTGDTYNIPLPTTIYGGYLDVVTGQLVATHDENGNLLTNQKLYFLPPTNINALAGVNNVWSDAGDVAVSYRVEQ